ncbi:MAG: hypothetical protein PHU95_01170 [Candidatus Thermoplasmatota archaeon]|nr:hypothetical protein [Candidatus Thermoplasmatota archaeon]MDD5778046.1 hypothetical protein [Candidatus Thermoplasmatota archaeon]
MSKALETKVNAAIVFRGDFVQVQEAKEALANAGVEIIYQRIVPAGVRLIVEEAGP